MDHELIFKVVNVFALLGWLCLFLIPHGVITQKFVRSGSWSLILSVAYSAALIGALFGGLKGDVTSIAGIKTAFQDSNWVLVGWIHYLAFDIMIGVWILEDSLKAKLPTPVVNIFLLLFNLCSVTICPPRNFAGCCGVNLCCCAHCRQ